MAYSLSSTLAIASLSAYLAARSSSTSSSDSLDAAAVAAAIASALGCAWIACLAISAFLPRPPAQEPVTEAEYSELVPPPTASATQSALYLDLLKRVLLNVSPAVRTTDHHFA